MRTRHRIALTGALVAACVALATAAPLLAPDDEQFTAQDAQQMIRTAATTLTPVYAPLAEQIAKDYDLAHKEGIGIDIGSGPGQLVLELCRQTRLHWVNADINPHFFAHFYDAATSAGVAHRVSAIFADAQALPFRDNYADVIVSRGSFQFWDDKALGFREAYRVLKPGGVAYIGRGFARDFPVEVARAIRESQKGEGHFPKYDLQETVAELRQALDAAGVPQYRIETPTPADAPELAQGYGVWVEFRKPAVGAKDMGR